MKVLAANVMIGAGRFSERTVLDQLLQFEATDLEAVARDVLAFRSRLLSRLRSAGVEAGEDEFPRPADPPVAATLLAEWYARTAVLLQRWAGHRVAVARCVANADPGRAQAIIEYEESAVGSRAAELAGELVLTALRERESSANRDEEVAELAKFRAMAHPLILPYDTEVLIAAARKLDVPCFKLDRDPYQGVTGAFRIRPNGLLMLGHARLQHMVDGTLCVDRSADVLPVARDRRKVHALLRSLGLPAPAVDPGSANCNSLLRARREARCVGYPVVVKPAVAGTGAVRCDIRDERALEVAVRAAQAVSHHLVVESYVAGDTYRILCAGQRVRAVLDVPAGQDVTSRCDASIVDAAARLAGALPAGMLAISLVTTDPGRPLRDGGGAFVSLDVAPELDAILPPGGELHRALAEDFVRWLFPDGQPSRIPVFSVTGTNGKTTTSRMIAAIMTAAGFKVGLACTEGVYIDGTLIEQGDMSGRNGHHRVFESKEVGLAVLETARGGILSSGFTFDASDISVCTNVTADHLGEYGIETLEQMADVKRLALARARTAVVLNADDPHCRTMAENLPGRRLYWCSLELGAADIERAGLDGDRFLVLEDRGGLEWIVSCDAGIRTDVMAVNDIPATFDGVARHNVINAMEAIAAALAYGTDPSVVRSAMAAFSMGIDSTPGRLNLYRGPGFAVLLDFVQNLDGMRRFCEFTGGLRIEGRRILVISVLARHSDATVREFARYAAAGFDHFICRDYSKLYDRQAGEIPQLLRAYLLEAGVDDSAIEIVLDERPAIDAALRLAQEGDLVAIMCGLNPQRIWDQVSDFARQSER